VITWKLEIGRLVIAAGIGVAGPESDSDGPEDLSGVSTTGGAFERATGPYSTDFRGEEPWEDYEEDDRTGFGFQR
jgi:hypothetical protein